MLINTEMLSKGISSWVENELIAKGSLVQQGLVTFIYLQAQDKISSLLAPLSILGDEKGMLDIDSLQTNALKGLEKMGGVYHIPLINYAFDKTDLEHIFHYIRGSM